ncbi:hypothetical protein AB1Y20_013121 [Prymnesium parvum]|uniref:Uncharacterized protein n=1 Tax=Prymnesium parvum TaxID=97485 RepID=A0AB34IJQ4_PRYPA
MGSPSMPPPHAATPQLHLLRVTAKDCGAGFFALALYAVNQIIWAEEHGFTPHVFFGERCRDGRPNRYFSAARGANMWEYYFYPSSHLVSTPSDFQLPPKELFRLHHLSKASVQTYPHGVYRSMKTPHWRYDDDWHWHMRRKAYRVLSRHMRIRPEPLQVARDFYDGNILSKGADKQLLGVHLRGTDKMRNIGGRIVPPAEYFPLIDFFLARRPNTVLLVATDSPSFLEQVGVRYRSRMVAYSALRSERNAFADRSLSDNYKKGEDALVDALMLSCSNFLIKPASALSEFSVYFNPALHNHTIELQYEVGLPPPRETMMKHFGSERDALRGRSRCPSAFNVS